VETERRRDCLFWASYLILLVFFLLRLLPFAFPESRMWGFNHLIFLPPAYTIGYLILGLFSFAAPFLPYARDWGEILIDRFSYLFFDNPRKYYFRFGFVAIMVGLFLLFPRPTHFLGDGYTILANLASPSGTFVKWSEKGITFVLLLIQSLIGAKGESSALWAFRIVSVVSGMIAVWFFLLIAEIISEDKIKRFLAFLVSFASGVLLLFFGYVENYPLVWIGLTGFVYFGLRWLKRGDGLLWALLFLVLGLLTHLETALFFPAIIYLFFTTGYGAKIYRNHKWPVWITLSLLAAAVMILFVWKYKTNLYIENIFLPLFIGKPIDPDYALISLPHLVDILNLLMLLSPLFFPLLIMAAKNIGQVNRRNDNRFLFLAAIGCLLFLFVIDPMLGMPRDWDLFSIVAYPVSLLLILLFGERDVGVVSKTAIAIAVFMLLAVLPYLIANLKREPSVAYARYTIDLDLKKSYPAYTIMLMYYEKAGDSAMTEAIYGKYHDLFPNDNLLKLAERAQEAGDFKKAADIARSMPPDKFSWRYHNLLSSIYFSQKDYARALKECDYAIQLNGYSPILYANRAKILSWQRQYEEALIYLEKAYLLDRHSIGILEGFTAMNLYTKRIDESIKYAYEMIRIDSTSYKAYYYLTRAYAMAGDLTQAELNYSRYLRYGTSDTLRERSINELEKTISQLKAKKQGNATE
jgi:tetratricopeptide (TPR) repeat protein